ncbi:hypothetical protein POM88_051650 [Heracleum sosnowskyi]|uniref:Uncharacterized protein n=1 Tax=Heracleum sosnowskyi TaxID=360622 RepID=A0AAD8H298_9APIA|nr:hypothetical protein POM88_051650 [Heracleum sosnowskyi]
MGVKILRQQHQMHFHHQQHMRSQASDRWVCSWILKYKTKMVPAVLNYTTHSEQSKTINGWYQTVKCPSCAVPHCPESQPHESLFVPFMEKSLIQTVGITKAGVPIVASREFAQSYNIVMLTAEQEKETEKEKESCCGVEISPWICVNFFVIIVLVLLCFGRYGTED